jgi:hypothetical protein
MKYNVYAVITGSKYIGEFEAASKEEAEDKAWETIGCDSVGLCHQCSSEIDEPTITSLNVEEE